MHRLALIIFSAFALLASPAMAKDARSAMWVVSQLSGDARVVHGGLQPASLKVNARLAPGDVVTTGITGRATLARGADYIVIAPRSELRLPSEPQPSGFTRVIQKLGTMLFKVQHTGTPHFIVDTPMLAAVVKGTTFTVIVDQNRSAVQVTQGAVEVTALEGGMKQLVEGGRTVFINHSDPKTLIDADGRTPNTATSSSSAIKISGSGKPSLASIAGLTAGLVRPAAVSQAASAAIVTSPVTGVPVATPMPTASAPTVTAPTITAPTVTPPTVTVPDVTTPTMTVPDITTPVVTVPEVTVPQVTVPDVTVPEITTPEVTVPEVTTPVVTVPEVTVPEVTTPEITVPAVTIPDVTTPEITVPEVTVPAVTTPVVAVPEVTIPEVTVPVVTLPGI